MKKDLSICIKQSKADYLAIVQSTIDDCSMVQIRSDSAGYIEKVCATSNTPLDQLGSRRKKHKISTEKDDNADDNADNKVVEEEEKEDDDDDDDNDDDDNHVDIDDDDNDMVNTDDNTDDDMTLGPSVVIFSTMATKYHIGTIKWLKELDKYKLQAKEEINKKIAVWF